ncbi:NlpC/P60 family protein [Actinomycetota bacterium Odt1-20B]
MDSPSAAADPLPPPHPAVTGETRLAAARARLDTLYREAERATDAYNAAKELVRLGERRTAAVDRSVVRLTLKVTELRDGVGWLARKQYQSGGLPPAAAALFSPDPGQYLRSQMTMGYGAGRVAGRVDQLRRAQRELAERQVHARRALAAVRALRRNKQTAQEKVQERVGQAEKLLADLTEQERRRLARAEEAAAWERQRRWLEHTSPSDLNRAAGPRGRRALHFAREQLGKPYVWGAEGPDTYDCSGLTQKAWQAAGVSIPRTSQEQWARLPHVALADLRKGDLVIYFHDATHVALYIGDGLILHAPRPGRHVTIGPAGGMPILGVVRPDAV